jgi:PKD repeat protein
MKSLSKLFIPVFAALALSFFASCDGDDPQVEKPVAIFDFVVNPNRSGQVSFTSESLRADSYAWDFGVEDDDDDVSTQENPSYTYEESGTYEVTLTVKNEGGEHSASLEIEVFVGAAELIKDGDMSKDDFWNTKQIWINSENAVNHAFKDGTFFIDNADGTEYSQYILWQEISVEANKEYVFSADIASTSGVNATGSIWLEVYFSKVDPNLSDPNNDYPMSNEKMMRLNFRQECGDGAFNGKLQVLAQPCEEESGTLNMGADGKFTLAASELNTGGKIFVAFKFGSWGDSQNFKDGMTLDNVSIKEDL